VEEASTGEGGRRARAMAVEAARAAGRPDLADDAALVITELVTNAVLHANGYVGADVRPTPDGLRIEVSDASPLPPVMGRESDEALTGRGLYMVSALAARWGVEPRPNGKVVWAEITGQSRPGRTAAASTAADVDPLAEWEAAAAANETLFHVELGDVPTDLLLAAKAHVENVAREFALAQAGAESGITEGFPEYLESALQALDDFAGARQSIKRQALAAAERADVKTRLGLDLPASGAEAAERYLAALDEVDAYCRAARLLTLETPPQHRVFRQWYIGELVAQLRAAAAGERPPPAQAFESRLLDELASLAANQRGSERDARMYAVSAALAAAETPESVAGVVLNEGVAALQAAAGGVLLATDEDRLALRGAVGYDEAVVARLRAESRDEQLPAAHALRTGESVWLESPTERDTRFPELVGMEETTVSLCAVPLEVRGRRLGALRFSFNEARLFDDEERRFVQALADLTAQSLERTQLQEARVDVSRRLQRSLLPPQLPAIPGLEAAAFYHPFGDGVDVGGDFYDMWDIADGRWGVAIGDASGTGPAAAALTALVRHTLRALTLGDAEPARVVRVLNTAMYAAAEDDDRFCTCVFGVVSLTADGAELTLAGGGHPPVVVSRADGTTEAVHVGGSLLGVFADPPVGSTVVRLGEGDLVVLLTDGVLEARREGVQFDLAGVTEVLRRAHVTSAGDAVTALEQAVLAHTGGHLGDDMAALSLSVTVR